MTFKYPERRLVAVVAADVVGYTRMMEMQEQDTHQRLKRLRSDVLEPEVAARHGRIIRNTGDGFLAIFDSALNATRCCLEMQRRITHATASEATDRRIVFRFGINIADAIIEKDDIYGGGVNIAARLQSYAEPGGIIVSAAVAEQISGRPDFFVIDIGDLHLKNLKQTVRAFKVCAGGNGTVAVALASSSSRPSIAVLPFRKNQVDQDEAYFADGIIEAIVHALAGLKELFVISRSSTLGYGGAIDVRAIGRELGVRYVLYGGVRRARGRVRITTELSDAETGAIVRPDQYDGKLEDLFELQDEISTRVVATIAPHVREHELRRALRKHPDNMTAYDLVLQALDVLYRFDYESFSRARGLLQQAIADDPGYAPAYSHVSYWHMLRIGQGWSADAAADTAEAARAAWAAIELDRNDALALAIYGHLQSFLLKDYSAAMEFLDRALAAGPNCADAWAYGSATCGYLGDGPTAVARAEHGLRLSPLSPDINWHEHMLSQAHYICGHYEEAVAWGRKSFGHNNSQTSNLRTLIASLVAVGDVEEARRIARRLLELQPNFRIETFKARTPLRGETRDTFVERLRLAGLPD